MRRPKLILTALAALLTGICHATCDSTTPPATTARFGLSEPVINSCGWGITTNANWDIVDADAACLACQNVFTTTQTFSSPIIASSITVNSNATINGQTIVKSIRYPDGTVQVSSRTVGANVLISSGIAFGSSANTVTSDTNTLRFTPTTGLYVGSTATFSSANSPQVNINNPNYQGVYNVAWEFSFGPYPENYFATTTAAFLCSDFSTTCMYNPMTFGSSPTPASNLFGMDTRGHFTAGGIVGSQSTGTILGNMLIGTGYPTITNAPTDGLLVKGSIKNDTLTASQFVKGKMSGIYHLVQGNRR